MKKPKKKAKELVQPILLEDPHKYAKMFSPNMPLLVPIGLEAAESKKVVIERTKKLPLLFAHYDIPIAATNKWQMLAQALACEYVPGFQVTRKEGRPRIETVEFLCRYYRAFKVMKAKLSKKRTKRISDKTVLYQLSKDKLFKETVPELSKANIKTLLNWLSKARELRKDWIRNPASPWISKYPSRLFLKYGAGYKGSKKVSRKD